MNKKISLSLALIALLVGLGGGILFANIYKSSPVNAQENTSCPVTQERLKKIYKVAFHRGLDKNADFHIGKGLDQVLEDIESSQEQQKYTALYQATKALEEMQREPGEVSSSTLETYRNYIDQAASIINEWAKTLPKQEESEKTVGPKRAQEAIQNAYNNLNETAKEHARKGLLRAQTRIGPPSKLPVPKQKGQKDENKNGDLTGLQDCESDSECVLANTDCCGCNMGGGYKCIDKEHKEAWESELECEGKNPNCIAQYNCPDAECQCVDGTCQIPSK